MRLEWINLARNQSYECMYVVVLRRTQGKEKNSKSFASVFILLSRMDKKEEVYIEEATLGAKASFLEPKCELRKAWSQSCGLRFKLKDKLMSYAWEHAYKHHHLCMREMIYKEDNGSKIDLEEIQEFADEEPIVNTNTQQEVVTPVKPDDISLPIRRTSGRVSKPPRFYYGFHIEEDKISDSTLSELDEPTNYKEAMASSEAAKWKEAIKSEI
ncbi:hypothetical protein Tco_1575628 [Tanacetum coccineum]